MDIIPYTASCVTGRWKCIRDEIRKEEGRRYEEDIELDLYRHQWRE